MTEPARQMSPGLQGGLPPPTSRTNISTAPIVNSHMQNSEWLPGRSLRPLTPCLPYFKQAMQDSIDTLSDASSCSSDNQDYRTLENQADMPQAQQPAPATSNTNWGVNRTGWPVAPSILAAARKHRLTEEHACDSIEGETSSMRHANAGRQTTDRTGQKATPASLIKKARTIRLTDNSNDSAQAGAPTELSKQQAGMMQHVQRPQHVGMLVADEQAQPWLSSDRKGEHHAGMTVAAAVYDGTRQVFYIAFGYSSTLPYCIAPALKDYQLDQWVLCMLVASPQCCKGKVAPHCSTPQH